MSEPLSQQVEDDLTPLFRKAPASGRQATYAPTLTPDEPRRSFPALGLIVAASLLGVSAASLLWRPEAPTPKKAVPATAPAARAPSSEPLQLRVFLSDAPPEPAAAQPQAPTPAEGQGLPNPVLRAPVLAASPSTEIAGPPAVTRRPVEVAAAPRAVPEFTTAAPEETPCQGDPDACESAAVTEADQDLADAYRQAWRARVPERRLRALQRTWREGRGYAADDSTTSLLEAYAVRTQDVWGLVDQWVREVDGQ